MRVATGNLFEHVEAVAKDAVAVRLLPTQLTLTLTVIHTVIETGSRILLHAERIARRVAILVVLRGAHGCHAHHGAMIRTGFLNIAIIDLAKNGLLQK